MAASTQTVIETPTGWMVRCQICGHHEFPKAQRPNATWEFDGNPQSPTFKPSMNECVNPPDSLHHRPDVPTRRCHFVVTKGQIHYCADCSHRLAGQKFPLEPWPQDQVDYYAALLRQPQG